MTVFSSPEAFAKHIGEYGTKIQGREYVATLAASKAAEAAIKTSGARYHIKARGGRRVALGAKAHPPVKAGGTTQALIEAIPQGFWHLVEHGAKPHEIQPRRRGRKGSGSKRALTVNGGLFARVHHPGTGSIGHPWVEGVAKAAVASPVAFDAQILSVFLKAA